MIGTYYRLSLADEDVGADKAESNSIQGQRGLVEGYIMAHPELATEPRQEYVDDGYSGTSTSRPAFQRLIQDAQDGKVKTIIVKDFSRFARDYIEAGDYMERIFPLLGVRFISVNDGYDSGMQAGNDVRGLEVAIKNIINASYSRDGKHQAGNYTKHQYPLKGKVYCGYCQKLMKYRVLKKLGPSFNCRFSATAVDSPCKRIPISEELLEEIVRNALTAQIKQAEHILEILRERERKALICFSALERQEEKLSVEKAEIVKQRVALYEQYADGNMSKEEFIRQRAAYRVQEDERMAQIQRLRTEKNRIFQPVKKDADNLQTVVSAVEEEKSRAQELSVREISLIRELAQIRKEHKRELEYEKFDGYELPPRTQFSMPNKPAVSIKYGVMKFNMACIRLFEGIKYVLPILHPNKKRLALIMCPEEDSASVEWARQKDENWVNKDITSLEFVENIFRLMNWNRECRYKVLGRVANSDQGLCMLFDLEEAIMFTPKPQEYTDPLTGEMKKKQMKFFPDAYKNRIGKSYNDYIADHQMNMFEDFIGYQSSTVLDEPEREAGTTSIPIPQREESENIPLPDLPEQLENVQQSGNEIAERGMQT